MARVSNVLITILNVVTLAASLAAIGYAGWVYARGDDATLCHRVVQKPILIVGLALLVVSMFGILGSCCKVQLFLWVYVILMFLLTVALFCFAIFTIVVTNKGVGAAVSRRGFMEYRLGDYNGWLRKYVVNAKNWDKFKSCLVDVQFCQTLKDVTSPDFTHRELSPTLSGCCKPPAYCGYEFVNATFWKIPKAKGDAAMDSDCTTWSNTQTQLCFDCNSCKAGILDNIKNQWRLLSIFNFCLTVFVIVVYSIGCCALRNNRSDKYQRHKNYA